VVRSYRTQFRTRELDSLWLGGIRRLSRGIGRTAGNDYDYERNDEPAHRGLDEWKEATVCIGAHELMTDEFLLAAIEEAEAGLREGGIPIGSVLVHDGRVIGRGHNRRVQRGSAVLHGEMDALESAGRLPAKVYRESVLYTTLSPCPMCTGAILLYGIPRVVIGENRTFLGDEDLLRLRGVSVEVVQDARCIELMTDFIRTRPELWNEDIGE
jgi:creatinine deaminase